MCVARWWGWRWLLLVVVAMEGVHHGQLPCALERVPAPAACAIAALHPWPCGLLLHPSAHVHTAAAAPAQDELSGADIKAVCTEAGLLALRERRMRVTQVGVGLLALRHAGAFVLRRHEQGSASVEVLDTGRHARALRAAHCCALCQCSLYCAAAWRGRGPGGLAAHMSTGARVRTRRPTSARPRRR